jgi:hypothetical protein
VCLENLQGAMIINLCIPGKKSIDPEKFLDNLNESLKLNTCILIQLLTSKFGSSPLKYWDSGLKLKLSTLAKEDKDSRIKQVRIIFNCHLSL